ncbi:MAG: hypothetical protein NTZ49_03705 [Candidatus Parcubacteria bacterium]|nr:hypothetical protein [Candidatus Parcubacteria bacterium]
MSTGVGIDASFNTCYKCNKKLNFFEGICLSCGADNGKLMIFRILTRILIFIIFALFAIMFVPALASLIGSFGILPVSLNNIAMMIFSLEKNSTVLIGYIGLIIVTTFIIALIGNFYKSSLIQKEQAKDPTAKAVPDKSLDGFAKANFTPGQYKVFRAVLIAFLFFFILPFISGSLIFIINLEENPGWGILLIFLTMASGFIAAGLMITIIVSYAILALKNKK